MIEPNETHVLKAVAWDALRTSTELEEGLTGHQVEVMAQLRVIMDSLLETVAKKLSNPETWEEKGNEK